MRLRYLSLRDAPPLQDLAIPFWQEMVLGRACAIRFVVGVNGSGKSRLLQALAQIFLTIERFPSAELPFYVTLVYDLGKGEDKRTIFLQYQKKQEETDSAELKLIRFKEGLPQDKKYDWENLLNEVSDIEFEKFRGTASDREYFLPKAFIAYTSGVIPPWKRIFSPPLLTLSIPQLEEVEERPLNWEVGKERQYLREQGLVEAADNLTTYDINNQSEKNALSNGFLIDAEQLRLVVLAVTLMQAATDFKKMTNQAEEDILLKKWDDAIVENYLQSGFRPLLNEIGWRYPVTIGLKINFQPDDLMPSDRFKMQKIYKVASRVIGEPEPGNKRTVLFDLREKQGKHLVVDALIKAFKEDEKEITSFDIFKTLYHWQQVGILEGVVIAMKKRGVKDLMLYDWLSDGEQLFLGRMAMFHLLKGEDDVLALLDEPETHFNDVWKRRIVDVIDDSLRDRHNEIVITTHSSIALTDVFRREVTRLKFEVEGGKAHFIENYIDTFGASPTVIMREIFGAPEGVGQRAAEFLDLILMLATKPKEVDAIWQQNISKKKLEKSVELNQLVIYIKEAQVNDQLPHDYGDDKELKAYLIKILISVKNYVEKVKQTDTVTVVDALLTLEDNIGEGYYQFEFRRRLRALQKL
ncbi:MAG: hypothetical protein R3E32_13800 [Chitinophagales bacterium]